MLKEIFVSHSRSSDFVNELYAPLKNSPLYLKFKFFFPHEEGQDVNTKEIIQNVDLVIAEVSYPSTGQGIELGWADIFKKPIICFYRQGTTISHSLQKISNQLVDYSSPQDLINKLEKILELTLK